MACHEASWGQMLHLSQAAAVSRYISRKGDLHAVDLSHTRGILVYGIRHGGGGRGRKERCDNVINRSDAGVPAVHAMQLPEFEHTALHGTQWDCSHAKRQPSPGERERKSRLARNISDETLLMLLASMKQQGFVLSLPVPLRSGLL